MRRISLLLSLLLLALSPLFSSAVDPAGMTDQEILSELESNSTQLSLSLTQAEAKIAALSQSLETAQDSLTLSQTSLARAQGLLTEQAKTLGQQQASLNAMSSSLQSCVKDIKAQTRLSWAIGITAGVSVSLMVLLLIMK